MRRVLSTVSTLTTGGLGVAINFATGSTSSVLAWGAVLLLAGASGVFSFFLVDRPGASSSHPSLVISGDVQNDGTLNVGPRIHNHGVSGRQLAVVATVVVAAVATIGVVSVAARPDPVAQARAAAAVGGAPLVTAEIADGNCGNYGWITPLSPAEIAEQPPKPEELGWTEWAPTARGAAADEQLVTLSVQGAGSAQVTLTDIRARVVERAAPLVGTALAGACGSEGAYRLLRIDLDQDPPRASAQSNGDSTPAPGTPDWATTPARFPYRVSMSDTETFAIYADTAQSDVRWVIEVDWSSGNRSGTLTVDDEGQPFRTSSTSAAQSCDYASGELIC